MRQYMIFFKNSQQIILAPNLYQAKLTALKVFKPSKRDKGLITAQLISEHNPINLH
jgi:hypothetical protein